MTTDRFLTVEVRIVGLPPSVNTTRRRHWTTVSGETETWRRTAKLTALDVVNRHPLRRRFPIWPAELELVFATPRPTVDLDNLVASAKPIIDGIVDSGLVAGDHVDAIRCLTARWTRSSETGVIVRIKEAP